MSLTVLHAHQMSDASDIQYTHQHGQQNDSTAPSKNSHDTHFGRTPYPTLRCRCVGLAACMAWRSSHGSLYLRDLRNRCRRAVVLFVDVHCRWFDLRLSHDCRRRTKCLEAARPRNKPAPPRAAWCNIRHPNNCRHPKSNKVTTLRRARTP